VAYSRLTNIRQYQAAEKVTTVLDPGVGEPIGHAVIRPRRQVEETIRAAILSGRIKSGEMLPPETELARQFNVSRATLREALRVLASQHLIARVPGARGGNLVQVVDHHSLGSVMIEAVENLLALGSLKFGEVADVRQCLEVPSVRLAATHRSDPDMARLSEIVARQKAALVSDPEVPDLDRQFHTLIAEASGNRVLAALVGALHHATEPVHYLDLSPEVGRETVRHHGAILHAIQRRDPDSAAVAVTRHLTYLRQHHMLAWLVDRA
jgi:GntR family transcriptional repressor for pyruvate dehydrogenase complex